LDLVTPELKEKLLPLNTKLKTFEKQREERRKVRRKTKAEAKNDAVAGAQAQGPSTSSEADVAMESGSSLEPVPAAIEDEPSTREREVEELTGLIHPDLAVDVGCSLHGLYELCGTSHTLLVFACTDNTYRHCYT
jgi:ubiquitin carboxyl-terminal hydrolase 14